jgi:Domain of unknown function (DUF4956)
MDRDMTKWLAELTSLWGGKAPELSAGGFLLLLAISALAAMLLAFLYSRFYGGRSAGSEIHRSFPLLSIAITAIFVCIQFSLPLSLGLLGALSIVRFRTPIKEPEEIGFLMVVIATSLAAATGMLAFLALVLVAAVVALLLQSRGRTIFRHRADSGLVVVSLPVSTYAASGPALFEELAACGRRGSLESLTTQDERITVTWRFQGMPGQQAPALERRLSERVAPLSLAIVYTTESSLT